MFFQDRYTYKDNKIIYNNGRIDLQYMKPCKSFDMYDTSVPSSNQINGYSEALTGLKTNTTLSKLFFSGENIQILQNGIRAGVYKKSQNKYIIDEQDETNLKIIMRTMFLNYARHVPKKIKEEIVYLNNIILDHCIHNVFNNVISYEKYIRDANTLPTPPDNPTVNSLKGNKQLELKPWF